MLAGTSRPDCVSRAFPSAFASGQALPAKCRGLIGSKDVISRPRAFTSGARDLARSVRGPTTLRARSLTRLNCAEFRDDATRRAPPGYEGANAATRRGFAFLSVPERNAPVEMTDRGTTPLVMTPNG